MLIGLILGLLLFTFKIIGFNFSFFPGDLGDSRLNLYFLEHAYKFFTGNIHAYWDAPFMYPEKNVIAYSDNLLGSAPIYSIFRLMGFDIYKSFQLWFVSVSALNYISAFFFLKYIFKSNYSAVLGAFVFAFSLALQSQLTHAQTFPRFAIPIALLMAVKFSEELKPKYFFCLLLSIVYQIYCGIYLGFMLAVPVGIYVLLTIIKKWSVEKKLFLSYKWLLHIGLYGLLNFVILLPLLLPYTERKITPTIYQYKQIVSTIPTLRSHLFSQHGSLIWNFLSKTGLRYEAWWDHQIFAGGIATLCLIIGIFLLFSHAIKSKFRLTSFSVPLTLIFTGLITFFLYIRFRGISAYLTLYFLPGFCSMRCITRIINIELIFFAISTAFVFSNIFKKTSKYGLIIFVAALLLVISDNYYHTEESYRTKVSVAKERIANIEKALTEIPTGSIVSYEPLSPKLPVLFYQIDAMLISQKYQLKTLNGYSGTGPENYGRYWTEPNEQSRKFWLNNKILDQDTLYVIKSPDILEIVTLK
jgi:hypothetical protein